MSPGRPGIVLALTASVASQVELDGDGRWSRRFGRSNQAWVIVQRLKASGAVELGALLVPVEKNDPAPVPALQLISESDSSLTKVKLGGREHRVRLALADSVPTVRLES
jgi:hypothetical protein